MYGFENIINRKNTASTKWDKYKDTDILPLWQADMDFMAPPEMLKALKNRIDHGIFGYTELQNSIKNDILNYLREEYTWNVESENIIWLPGIVTGMNIVCRSLTEADESIITFTPIYPQFLKAPENSQRFLITIPLVEQGNTWKINFEELESIIISSEEKRPKLILLCNPHNPLGRMWTRGELMQLLELAIKYNLIICSDEMHCDLILSDNKKHIPFASLNKSAESCTITLMSPSKTYNTASLGCAFAVVQDSKLFYSLEGFMKGLYHSPNIMGLIACQSAYVNCQDWKNHLQQYLKQNRDTLFRALSDFIDIKAWAPEAGFLMWIDMRKFCAKYSIDNPVTFFEKYGVGLSNGTDFRAPGFVRLNFACSEVILHEAICRIRSAIMSKISYK